MFFVVVVCRTWVHHFRYLLEKSRVVGHQFGERNYHVFYQLLAIAAADDVIADRLALTDTQYVQSLSCFPFVWLQRATPVNKGRCFAATS